MGGFTPLQHHQFKPSLYRAALHHAPQIKAREQGCDGKALAATAGLHGQAQRAPTVGVVQLQYDPRRGYFRKLNGNHLRCRIGIHQQVELIGVGLEGGGGDGEHRIAVGVGGKIVGGGEADFGGGGLREGVFRIGQCAKLAVLKVPVPVDHFGGSALIGEVEGGGFLLVGLPTEVGLQGRDGYIVASGVAAVSVAGDQADRVDARLGVSVGGVQLCTGTAITEVPLASFGFVPGVVGELHGELIGFPGELREGHIVDTERIARATVDGTEPKLRRRSEPPKTPAGQQQIVLAHIASYPRLVGLMNGVVVSKTTHATEVDPAVGGEMGVSEFVGKYGVFEPKFFVSSDFHYGIFEIVRY